MAKGGSRAGAGRPPSLPPELRLWLGAECERRFEEAWEAAEQLRLDQRPGADVRREVLRQLDQVPVAERHAFINSAGGRELLEEGREAIRVMRRVPAFVDQPSLLVTREAPRPKGVKSGICAAVSAEAAASWSIEVTPRMAQRCWDEFRSFRRRLAEDQD